MDTRHFNTLVTPQTEVASKLKSDIGLKHWQVEEGHNVVYQNDDFHTLSLYLKGGENNIRLDQPSNKGSAGQFCFMAQSQASTWQIKQRTEFAHIYFSKTLVNHFAASTHQMDTRFIELTDKVFLKDDYLHQLFLQYFSAKRLNTANGELFAEQVSYKLLDKIVSEFNGFNVKSKEVVGGLSPQHRRQVFARIMDSLGHKITITELAKEVNLSPHHFAKMFKLSCGESPASFVSWLRIEEAKKQLKTQLPLSQISAQLGFTHQSHMTQSFKRMIGVTPARYRTFFKD